MPAPRIGLTTYARNEENWFRLPAEYIDSVRRAGGMPVLMAPGEPHLEDWVAGLDALILTGGGDLDPDTHGGTHHETIYGVDPIRDRDEVTLTQIIVSSGLPTLCICRGLQVLNVALGGTLIEHLPDEVGDDVRHRSQDREPIPHSVRVEPGSFLASVLEETELEGPASWHHQAVRDLGLGLVVTARAPDGTIEAIELPNHPWLLAVQWHPELTTADDPVQQRIFDALVRGARSPSD